MKILVLSDSHSSLYFMRSAIAKVRPNAVVHLGDYYEDAEALEEENAHIPFHIVPGNCDLYRSGGLKPGVLCYNICGVRLFMTHGHIHKVKLTLGLLLKDARQMKAQAALYGHTHRPDCHQEEDGLWVLNPGSCGHSGGSVGVIETENGRIISCRIIGQEELEEYK